MIKINKNIVDYIISKRIDNIQAMIGQLPKDIQNTIGEYQDGNYNITDRHWFKNKILNSLVSNKYLGETFLDWVYTTTQFFTFHRNNVYGKVQLYRGLRFTEQEELIYQDLIKSRRITTDRISSFTEDYGTAKDFAMVHASNYPHGIVFSMNINSRKILCTYKDWLWSYEEQKEYLVYNNEKSSFFIKIEKTL